MALQMWKFLHIAFSYLQPQNFLSKTFHAHGTFMYIMYVQL